MSKKNKNTNDNANVFISMELTPATIVAKVTLLLQTYIQHYMAKQYHKNYLVLKFHVNNENEGIVLANLVNALRQAEYVVGFYNCLEANTEEYDCYIKIQWPNLSNK
jgi:hypothetical protein